MSVVPGREEETPREHEKPLKRPSSRRAGSPARVTRALERVNLTSKTELEPHAPGRSTKGLPAKVPQSLSSCPPVPYHRKGVPFTEKTPCFHERVRSGKGPVGSRAAAGSWTSSKTTGKDSRLSVKTRNASLCLVLLSAGPSVHPSATASWALGAASSGRLCFVDLFQGLVLRLCSLICKNGAGELRTRRTGQRAARGHCVRAEKGTRCAVRASGDAPCATRLGGQGQGT